MEHFCFLLPLSVAGSLAALESVWRFWCLWAVRTRTRLSACWQSMERVFNILLDGTGFVTDWEVCESHHAGDMTIH